MVWGVVGWSSVGWLEQLRIKLSKLPTKLKLKLKMSLAKRKKRKFVFGGASFILILYSNVMLKYEIY